MSESKEAPDATAARVQAAIDAHEKQGSRPLEEILAYLCDSERHFQVVHVWDAGIDVTLDFLDLDKAKLRNVAEPRDIAAAIEEMMNDE